MAKDVAPTRRESLGPSRAAPLLDLVPPVRIELIFGRLSSGCSAIELQGHWWVVEESNLAPFGSYFTDSAGNLAV